MTHREARIAHEKKIAKLKTELATIEAGIEKERAAEQRIDSDIAALALKASSGDKDALRKQRELRDRKGEHHLQQENLETLAVPIRADITAAEDQLRNLRSSELSEEIAESVPELEGMGKELSGAIPAVAERIGAFKIRFDDLAARALAILGSDRAAALQTRLQHAVQRATRVAVATAFRKQGLSIVDLPTHEKGTFESILTSALEDLRAAIASGLPANPGRTTTFRATTRISGFHGLTLEADETIVLAPDDPEALRLMESGALEQVGVANAAGGGN